MTTPELRFDNGAAYERFMGLWSRSVGEAFLDWLAPPPGAHWLDIGCGNGAFTELLAARCAPGVLEGLDPSPEQLAFAAARPALKGARFHQGDAMALPLPAASVDQAVMPLVLFFVPEPARGVAEMVRVTRPGGSVSAYCWDMTGGGFPYDGLKVAMREMGLTVMTPPSEEASRLDVMQELWRGAGLADVETRVITVQRTFADFDDYWTTSLGGPSVSATLAPVSAEKVAGLQATMRARLPVAADGSITLSGRAHAVKGRVHG